MKNKRPKLFLIITIAFLLVIIFCTLGYLKSDTIFYNDLLKKNNLSNPKQVFLWALKNYHNPAGNRTTPYLSPKYLIVTRKWLYCDEGAIVMATLDHRLGYETRLIDLYGQDNISHHTVLQVKENGLWNTYDFTYRVINKPFNTCTRLYGFEVKEPKAKPYPRFYNYVVNNNFYLKQIVFKIRGISEN